MTQNIKNRKNKFVLTVLSFSTYQGDLIQYKNYCDFQKNSERYAPKILNSQKKT